MSPSTAPLSCSLTRTARMVPLTRPQIVTSCAMTLPSICAPSPIRSSEARTSPLIWPKICAGPLHSMLPTIDIPEPMQERVAAFVVGSRLSEGCSTTDCCCCAVLPTTSAASAATSLSFSGALLLNIPHLRVPPAFTAERPKLRDQARDDAEPFTPPKGGPQVRTPFENRTAQNRTATTRAQTIVSHSMYGASPTIHAPGVPGLSITVPVIASSAPMRRANWISQPPQGLQVACLRLACDWRDIDEREPARGPE